MQDTREANRAKKKSVSLKGKDSLSPSHQEEHLSLVVVWAE